MTEAPSLIDVRPTSGLLKALADDTRLRMVALLAQGELCVCHIRAILDGFTELEPAVKDRRRLALTKGGVSCA